MDDHELARWQAQEREHGFIRARLQLLRTEQGGRQGPIYSGYRACWGFPPEVRADMHDGPLLIEGEGVLGPGEVALVRIHPLFPEYWPEVLNGLTMGMFEGTRKVGEAVVVKVVVAPSD